MSLDFDDGTTLTNPAVSGATMSYSHVYGATGTYTASLVVANILNGGITATCSVSPSVEIVPVPVPGTCGTVDGATYYDLDGDGSELTAGSENLCGDGTVTGFVFNGTNEWTWTCAGLYGGASSPTCSANQSYCADGVVDTGAFANTAATETCDDSNTASGDGCDAVCTLETQSCTIVMTPNVGSGSLNAVFTLTTDNWITSGYVDLGNGTETLPTFNGSVTYTGDASYTTVGAFTVTGYVDHPYNTGAVEVCTTSVTLDSAVVCGPADGNAFYSGSTFTDTQLCTNGTTGNNLIYDAGAKKWTWSCISEL